MTNEQMDRAVAEYVGEDRWIMVKRGYFYRPLGHGYTRCESEAWVLPLVEAKKHEYLKGEQPVTLRKAATPAYSTDLNAMHEAEKVILQNADTGYDYDCNMNVVCETWEDGVMNYMKLWHATAAQRAEAFLRTIGKYHATETLP